MSDKLLGSVTIEKSILEDTKKHIKNIEDFGKKIEEYSSQSVTNLLGIILFGAINLEASDIHIEPQKEKIRLRIRLDGILHDVIFFGTLTYHNLLSRLKLLSKIKLNITEKPQDGRFTIAIEDSLIEIRISSLPSEWGESIVMRILNPKNLMKLETLGLRKDLYDILDEELTKPSGMILVSGPTGSGKTTTLYAVLMKIYNPGVKVITIEDPIEYHLTGISQTQVEPDKGYDFADGLSSIVRQDPDVILVGEIRDPETAKIAVRAALTGHLVLSTLHTNDAAGTVPRLVDSGVNLTSISPALKVVISQRLIRLVCKKCSVLTKARAEELKEISKGLKGITKSKLSKEDLEKIKSFVTKNPQGKIAKIKEKSCKDCNFTGYKGRKGIFEVCVVDNELEKFILTNPPVSSIKKLLVKKGMITIYQSGLIAVALGETTLSEIKRVVEADDE